MEGHERRDERKEGAQACQRRWGKVRPGLNRQSPKLQAEKETKPEKWKRRKTLSAVEEDTLPERQHEYNVYPSGKADSAGGGHLEISRSSSSVSTLRT